MDTIYKRENIKPLISVVLGSYNRLQFLKQIILTLRSELKKMPHELIVVDGGSTDGTLKWLLKQKDIITIVQHNHGNWQDKPIKKRSWGYFMNLGFRAASSKYVCMVSDDCLVLPGAIVNGYKLFEQELKKGRKIGAVAFYAREWSQEKNYYIRYTLGKKLYVNHGIYLKEALHKVNYIDEENFFFYNADADLCLKMWKEGYEVIESKNSYVEHYPHANIKQRKKNHEKYQQDGESFLKKWFGLYYDGSKESQGFVKEKTYKDPNSTGDLFLKNHGDVLIKNPSILFSKLKLKVRDFLG